MAKLINIADMPVHLTGACQTAVHDIWTCAMQTRLL
jgi:hypothetical protein